MKRVWLASAAAMCAAFALSSAAAQTGEPTGVVITRGAAEASDAAGVVVTRGGATTASAAPRLVIIEPPAEADAKATRVGDAELAGADAAPVEAAPAAPVRAAPAAAASEASEATEPEPVEGAVPVAAAAGTASAPAAVAVPASARALTPAARTPDINRVVLQALACSTGDAGPCARHDPGAPGAALIATGAESTAEQQQVAAMFRNTMAPVWAEQQQRAIVMIGYYSAAATLCEGAELSGVDVARLVRANFTLAPGATEEELRRRRDALSMHIGMATGLAMGAQSARIPAFCAEARANRYNFATPLLRVSADAGAVEVSPGPARPPLPAQHAAQ